MVGRPGSPRIAKAAQLLIENDNFTAKVALLMAGYDTSVACSSKAQKTVSKKKLRIINAVRLQEQREKMRKHRAKNNASLPTEVVTVSNQSSSTSNSNKTGVSSLTSTSFSNTNEGVAATLVSLSRDTSLSSKSKNKVPKSKAKPTKITARSKLIAANSRRTPQQVNKFYIEKKNR